jgi:hypothetical protein
MLLGHAKHATFGQTTHAEIAQTRKGMAKICKKTI